MFLDYATGIVVILGIWAFLSQGENSFALWFLEIVFRKLNEKYPFPECTKKFIFCTIMFKLCHFFLGKHSWEVLENYAMPFLLKFFPFKSVALALYIMC